MWKSRNKGRNTRIKIIGGVILLLLLINVVVWLTTRPNEVSTGEQAKARVASYEWYKAPHKIRLIDDPWEAFLIRQKMIREAKETIDICTFIWRDDESGLALMQELIAAAQQLGVNRQLANICGFPIPAENHDR